MKKEFAILRRLSLKSGWSWDYEEGVVVAPTPEILKASIQLLNKRWHYLEKKSFPWFEQMDKLMGGGKSRGDTRDVDHPLDTNTVGSAIGSQSGSSDNPPDDEDVGIDHSVHQQRDSQSTARQGSDSTFPTSRSSGSSKRKSVDSDQPLTQGKKVQRAINEKRREIMEINETNKELLNTVKDFFKGRSKRNDEMDKCVEKIDSWNMSGPMRFWLMTELKDKWFRRYFLGATFERIEEDYRNACPRPQGTMQFPPQFYSQPQPSMQPPPSNIQPPPSNIQPPSFDSAIYEHFNMFGINLRPPNP